MARELPTRSVSIHGLRSPSCRLVRPRRAHLFARGPRRARTRGAGIAPDGRPTADPHVHDDAGPRVRACPSACDPRRPRAGLGAHGGGQSPERSVAPDRRRHGPALCDDREQHDRRRTCRPRSMDLPRIGATPRHGDRNASPLTPRRSSAPGSRKRSSTSAASARSARPPTRRSRSRGTGADAQRLDIDFGVEEAYFSVLAAKAIVKASDEAYERSRVHRDLAKRGVDSGLRSPIELTRAEADLARFDVGRVRARGGVAVAQSVLVGGDWSARRRGRRRRPKRPPSATCRRSPRRSQLAQRRDPRLAETHRRSSRPPKSSTRAVGAELRPDLSLTATLSGRAGGAPPSSGPSAHGDGWVPERPELGRGPRALLAAVRRHDRRRDATPRASDGAGAPRRD